MSQVRRRVALAGVAALALGMGAAGSTVVAQADHVPPTASPSYVQSWLALSTGSSNQVRLVKASGGTPATQTLKAVKGCALDTTGSLLKFAGKPLIPRVDPSVGFSGGGIGVRESSTASGASCSAVDFANGESLTLELGSVGGLVAGSASLDMDLKQSAQILATATGADGKVVGYFELRSGQTILEPKPTGVSGAQLFTCNTPADSGPDAGIRNNCRWDISGPSWTRTTVNGHHVSAEDGIAFTKLELKALNGSFSVMGGAEGAVVNPEYAVPDYFGADKSASIIELVEGVVGCDETVTLRSSSTVPLSTWERLANFGTTSSDPCLAYPYATSSGTLAKNKPYAKFTKPLDFQTRSQALWTTTFVIKGSTVPDIIVDLDLPNGTVKTFDPLRACDPAWYLGAAFIGPPTEPLSPTACLVSGVRGSTTDTKDLVTYQAYIFGDAGMRR